MCVGSVYLSTTFNVTTKTPYAWLVDWAPSLGAWAELGPERM